MWLISDAPELSQNARQLFTNTENQVYLNVASAWEIIVKNKLGKLPLPEPAHDFVHNWRKRHQIETLPLDEPAVLQLSRLPEYHKDPFDRMLVHQAIRQHHTLVTDDSALEKYVSCGLTVLW